MLFYNVSLINALANLSKNNEEIVLYYILHAIIYLPLVKQDNL